jgi:hypothetical protein
MNSPIFRKQYHLSRSLFSIAFIAILAEPFFLDYFINEVKNLLLIVCFLVILLKRRVPILLTPLLVIALFLVMVSIFHGYHNMAILADLRRVFVPIVVAWMLIELSSSYQSDHNLAFASKIVFALQMLRLILILSKSSILPIPLADSFFSGVEGKGVIAGFYMINNPFSGINSISYFLYYILYRISKTSGDRSMSVFGTCISMLTTATSGSISFFVIDLISLSVLYGVLARSLYTRIILLLGVSAFAIWVTTVYFVIYEKFLADLPFYYNPVEHRLTQLATVIADLDTSPLFGMSLGNPNSLFLENSYLEILSKCGIIGIIIFLFSMLSLLFRNQPKPILPSYSCRLSVFIISLLAALVAPSFGNPFIVSTSGAASIYISYQIISYLSGSPRPVLGH